MRQRLGKFRQFLIIALAIAGLASSGCVHRHANRPLITVPPPGAVPRELEKVTLPEYVIEPPDVLLIEAYIVARPDKKASGKSDEFGGEIRRLPIQDVSGQYTVRPDGTVYLGFWGPVQVAGYGMTQAVSAIKETLLRELNANDPTPPTADSLYVLLDVAQYASKKYYVILDGGGAGEQVIPIPVTGSDTVLDALANVYGLPSVASKRNIWVARRTPHAGRTEQILPVDWVGITQHGVTATNYQIMPGDRIYVKAQRLVTVDTTLARILAPVERVFGVTLLGASTVNQIQGRGPGFGTGF